MRIVDARRNPGVGFQRLVVDKIVQVTMDDFTLAVGETTPANTASEDQFASMLEGGLIRYGPVFDALLDTLSKPLAKIDSMARGSNASRSAAPASWTQVLHSIFDFPLFLFCSA